MCTKPLPPSSANGLLMLPTTMCISLPETCAMIFSNRRVCRPRSCSTRNTISILVMLFLLLYDPILAVKYPLNRITRSHQNITSHYHLSRHSRRSPLVTHSAGASASGCPARCSCKWKSGKKYVECVGVDFAKVPSGVDSDAQVLDLSENPLVTLHNRVFLSNGLTNLQKIFLSR